MLWNEKQTPGDETGGWIRDISVSPLVSLAGREIWQDGTPYAHDRNLLIWTVKGQGRISLCHNVRGLGPHNVIYVPRGVPIGITQNATIFGQVLSLPAEQTPLNSEDELHMRISDSKAQAEINGHLDALSRELSGAAPAQHAAAMARVTLITVWLERQLSANPATPNRANAAETLVGRFSRMVEARHATGSTIYGYADALNVTPTHLTRCCKSVTGQTASEILAARIALAARRLLVETELSAMDISGRLGFRSAAYFSRFFQKNMGVTPISYRKKSKQPLNA